MRKYLIPLLLLIPMSSHADLIDPSFEGYPSAGGWHLFGSPGTLTLTDEFATEGTYSLYVTDRSQTYTSVAQTITSLVTPGVRYTYSVQVYPVNMPTAQTFSITLKQVDSAGTKYTNIDSQTIDHAQAWSKLRGVYAVSVTGTLTSLELYIQGPAKTVSFYVDAFHIEPPVTYIPIVDPDPLDFVRADGRLMVVGSGNTPVNMAGTNFVAYSDDNALPSVVYNGKNYDLSDYCKVAELGMGVVRLNMWYKVFEDDANPYTYKPEGWQWLEDNLMAARTCGVRLILDMHVPQGGYQLGGTSAFWGTDPIYRDRLEALWVAIATRYGSDTGIAAYDIMNEPYGSGTTAAWKVYVASVIAAIRNVDANHAVIAEEPFGTSDYFLSAQYLLEDDNVMYEFHLYPPAEYADQFLYGRGTLDGGVYPSTAKIFPSSYITGATATSPAAPTGTYEWTYVESSLIHMDLQDPTAFAAVPVLISNSNTGKVYFDDVIVVEYDSNEVPVRTVLNIQLEPKPSTWYLLPYTDQMITYSADWKRVGTGTLATATVPYVGAKSLSLSGTSGATTYLRNLKAAFPTRPGYAYRISGHVKGVAASGTTAFGLQFRTSGAALPALNKDYLRSVLLEQGVQFSIDNNVPVNIGEYGVSVMTFRGGRGGLAHVQDMLDLASEYQLGLQWFNYHGTAYGIYSNVYGFPDPAYGNDLLMLLFQDNLIGN